ncbi:hypothetical protein SAMN05216241_1112 [Limimonas halophila]|uniref:Uncharacterized protein n=1 Tax=Limimonas halophila TaxID=1082479 RepID=A0A1G7TYP6_9PROT|nr:hypothetical protein [Limimonas halophila]SDG40298.1 hypothetical protein SAMN05216241_1112 [Limimonas halophila]
MAAASPWPLPADTDARLRLAKGYPFPAPADAFLFRAGTHAPLGDTPLTGRTPVLAHGSNRSPEQLARKFAAFDGAASEIPVTYVWLHDHDVVYAAHFAHYASVTSALHHVPGCRVLVALTWLTPEQLARMHETEGAYSFRRLDGVRADAGSGPLPAETVIHLYHHDHGLLALDGAPVGLAAVPAVNRPHATLDQEAAQALARDRVAPERELDAFILENQADPALRREREAVLRKTALPAEVSDARPAH